MKYLRGGFTGPTKRDYNHHQPFGGSAASMLWVAFGDNDRLPDHWESDEVHLITSAYRPPMAVVELAKKQFAKPATLYATKPPYSATTSRDSKAQPAYLETQYLGNSFQMGSLVGGTRPGTDDVNGFKIIVRDPKWGSRTIQGVPGEDARFVGSPQYQKGKVAGENRVAQDRNLALWLVENGRSPWRWVVPSDYPVTTIRDVTFIKAPATWIALKGLGVSPATVDESETRELGEGKKTRFPGHRVLSATGSSSDFCGFAIEIGEAESHGTFEKFKADVLAAEVDVKELKSGIVRYRAAAHQLSEERPWLGIHWNENPHNLGVWKNGKRHDLSYHAQFIYRTEPPRNLIHAKWGEGRLTVRSRNFGFRCTVSKQGQVSFQNNPN